MLTSELEIEHPIILAGMAMVASPRLAAAVSNAGGLGVIGAGFPNPSPKNLRKQLRELKERLNDKTAFGVDLLIPKVGGNARKTNYDYTKGKLDEMIEIICESGCRLFVSAVGVPPRRIVDRLHRSGVFVMSMIGSPRHVRKCLDVGVDIICAQGTEGGGHTGEIATMALIPQVVDACAGRVSPLTGNPIIVVAAGGIYDGRTIAAALSLGASGVWIGTRFLASDEAATTIRHKKVLLEARADDTMRTVIFTGRPARVFKSPFVLEWEHQRQDEILEMTSRGKVPYKEILDKAIRDGTPISIAETGAYSFGQCCGGIHEIKPANQIVRDLVRGAVDVMKRNYNIVQRSRL
eukprot:g4556.t1